VPDSQGHADFLELTATARDHDAVTRSGSVLLDDGTALSYDSSAFDAGGLRLLRSGQRVRLRLDVPHPQGHITAITLASFDLP
jgi:hypothetical protein